jgi:Na+(H+)/acetate symporter ActP
MDHLGGMDAETWVVIKAILKICCENAVFIKSTQNKGLLHDL